MSSRIPPLLETYLALPPEASLVLLTGVLGASTNWLVLRHLHSYVRGRRSPATTAITGGEDGSRDGDGDGEAEVGVVLVSFLRDAAFWREGAGRLGLDLDAAGRRGRFVFVDGLTRLFVTPPPPPPPPQQHEATAPAQTWHRHLASAEAEGVAREIRAAVGEVRARGLRAMLVLDQVDFLLAGAGVAGVRLRDLLLELREEVHGTVVTVAADEPLVAAQNTTLEKEHAAFVLSLAHQAELVISLRLLDTGTANDVSGVARITRGGGEQVRELEEHEYLYHISGDGIARVFERGQ